MQAHSQKMSLFTARFQALGTRGCCECNGGGGGGDGETDKRETFLLPFSVLKVAIRISKGTGSSVPCIKSRVSSTVLSLSAVNGLMPSSVVLCRPRSFNSESFE